MALLDKILINETHSFDCYEITKTNDLFEVVLATGDCTSVIEALKSIEYIDIVSADGFLSNRFADYTSYSSITLNVDKYKDDSGNFVPCLRVVFKKTDLEEKVAQLDKKINAVVNEEGMTLEEYKEYKIGKTKKDLNMFLAANPLVSKAHAGVEGVYSITKEKQDLMTSNYLTYTIKKQVSPELAVLTWNEAGKECEVWEEQEFIQLVMEIEARVKPLVSYQQTVEAQIREASDKIAVSEIVCDYSTVGR